MSVRRVFVLIGAKGSGKSHIGRLIEDRLGIPFVPVEPLALRIRGTRPVDDPGYGVEVFDAIAATLVSRLQTEPELVFESTGLGRPFQTLVERLRPLATVLPIRVAAPPELCLRRVRTRDQAAHVDVSAAVVERINAAVAASVSAGVHPFIGTIENDDAGPDDLVRAFTAIRDRARSGAPPAREPA